MPDGAACLDENIVDQFVAGTLGASARRRAEEHLARCAECRILVSALVRGQSTTSLGEDVPRSATGGGTAPVMTFASGDVVGGRYRIRRILGTGGMAEVYEAEDRELGSRIALKVIRQDTLTRPRIIDRFRREASLARRVTHPNVCRIFDLGFHDRAASRLPFLTMELLTGRTLAERLRDEGPFDEPRALVLVEQLVAGLGAAHAAGILHRDFKSQNVILVDDDGGGVRAVITDFGLATSLSADDAQGTISGDMLVGSPAYMAPEQLLGLELSPRTDVYALGVVLYEMMTGALPFVGATVIETASKRLTTDPVRPSVHVEGLSDAWCDVILRCLEREPGARFFPVGDVLGALVAPVSSPAPRVPGTAHRLRAAFGVAILATAAIVAWRLWERAPDEPRSAQPAPSSPVATGGVAPPPSTTALRASAEAAPGTIAAPPRASASSREPPRSVSANHASSSRVPALEPRAPASADAAPQRLITEYPGE